MIRRALLFAGLLAAGCERARESDPAAATQAFFAQLAEKRVGAAFSDTTFFFQHQQSKRQFEAVARELGLVGCTGLKADAPAIGGRTAKQHIEVRTREGAPMPLVVTLVFERRAWRVFSLRSPMDIETGISENHFTRIGKGAEVLNIHDRPAPDERTTLAMAKETMLQFHDAIQQKSFEDFYESVSHSWQQQLTLGMLTRTFQGFISQRTNLIAIKDLSAVLNEPPRIDSEGLLTVTGSYATQPQRIDFELKYYYELPNWRPFGVTVRMMQ